MVEPMADAFEETAKDDWPYGDLATEFLDLYLLVTVGRNRWDYALDPQNVKHFLQRVDTANKPS